LFGGSPIKKQQSSIGKEAALEFIVYDEKDKLAQFVENMAGFIMNEEIAVPPNLL
jgi:hypothetical protein